MAHASISMVLSRLGPIIEKNVKKEVSLLLHSPEEAKKLATKLSRIQQVLGDAERRGVTEPKVKSWLDRLEEISYEIDDVLDEVDWESIRLEMDSLEYEAARSPWEKVTYFLHFCSISYRRAFETRTISLNVKQMNERVDSIAEENQNDFKFIPNLTTDSHDFKRLMTTSFVDVSQVHGRNNDREILVGKLLSEANTSSQMESGIQVISIVGAGGMGKTTLAQAVFNDGRVESHFDERVWICASHPSDEIRIARAILGALTKDLPDVSELETLLQCIMGEISGKNFLLVLDDVWTDDETWWRPLGICLNKGGPESRILVTTRNSRAAQVMGGARIQIQPLHPLSDAYCWRIFSQIALRDRTERDRQILEETGLKIVNKCRGLPLAAKAIGSLLQFKSGLDEWRKVSDSHLWEWEAAKTQIFPVLTLSYSDLHPVAMRCFSYCAILPRNEWIDVDMLIRMWCALGFLSTGSSSDDIESKGREVFDDLAMRSFFQDIEKDIQNRAAFCKMHDIMHDFAQYLAKNDCMIVEDVHSGARLAYDQSVRHLNLHIDRVLNSALHLNLHVDRVLKSHISVSNEKCRSFWCSGRGTNYAIPPNVLQSLKRVRVLIVPSCQLKISEIENLIHLRYLDLTENKMMELPEAMCDLYNLETLILVRCCHLSGLPQGIHKLRKLRHFLNDETDLELPDGFRELTHLRTLSKISAASTKNWKNLEMLRNLNQLRSCLRIDVMGSDNTIQMAALISAAEKANMKNKNLIQELYLFYGGEASSQVTNCLEPHPNLLIHTFFGPHLPQWVASLTNLKELTVCITKDESTESFSSLPPLGKLLPFLEFLWLCRMVGMKQLSRMFLGIDTAQPTESHAFPSLKRFSFSDCKEWKEWEDISEEEEKNSNIFILPSLLCLELRNCNELRTLPCRLLRKASSLKHLITKGCDYLDTGSNDWGQSLTYPAWLHPINEVSYEKDGQVNSKCLTLDVIQRGKLREGLW